FVVDGGFPNAEQAPELAEWTDNNGPSLIIDATGSPHSLAAAIDNVATAGRAVCVGLSDRDWVFDMRKLVSKEMDLRGCRNSKNLSHYCLEIMQTLPPYRRALISRSLERKAQH